ncbi:putative membrane protein, partial [Bacteroides fragilis str. 3397 T10]
LVIKTAFYLFCMWAFISIIDVSKDERLLKHIHC